MPLRTNLTLSKGCNELSKLVYTYMGLIKCVTHGNPVNFPNHQCGESIFDYDSDLLIPLNFPV